MRFSSLRKRAEAVSPDGLRSSRPGMTERPTKPGHNHGNCNSAEPWPVLPPYSDLAGIPEFRPLRVHKSKVREYPGSVQYTAAPQEICDAARPTGGLTATCSLGSYTPTPRGAPSLSSPCRHQSSVDWIAEKQPERQRSTLFLNP
ncbi:hypothetical protein DPEC_G00030790 [Dallia pectoralis]|uniref:Uncharacterized protein n=1 Tax=Dallia pectoralis TaxID=75939 RepID=A0ACC2HCV5_DALPE|nr:hypothetical protein DPEC_G00030790 [Dallia pectoralis]